MGALSALILAAGVLKPSLVSAQSGGQTAQFLNYGAGARALGMGGAFYAVADDATAAYWNPAGLPQVGRKELSVMQATLFADTDLQFLSYAHPTAVGGTFSIGVTQLVSKGFEKISVTVDPNTAQINIQNLGTFDDVERAYMLGWGRHLTEKLSFGFTGKYISRQLDQSTDSMQSLDLGMLYRAGGYRLALGVQNIAGRTSGDTSDTLPIVIKAGNAVRLFKDRLVMGLDAQKPADGELGWRFGGEYWLLTWWALRFGVLGSPQLQETDFGFGLKFKYLSLDIAQGIHQLGTTTRASVSTRFGQSISERHDAEVKRLIGDGLRAFQAGDFTRAVDRLTAAADADPGNQTVRRALSRLETAIGFVAQATGADEASTFTRKGVISYVEGRDLRTSVNALRYAYNKNPKDDKLLALLNLAEKEAGMPELTRKPDGPEVFSLIDQKIYDARQSIYDGKYDLALRRCMDVLELEPRNARALEIMGSAFYLMDQRDKARQVWQRVLEIEPDNRVVAEFLRKVGP